MIFYDYIYVHIWRICNVCETHSKKLKITILWSTESTEATKCATWHLQSWRGWTLNPWLPLLANDCNISHQTGFSRKIIDLKVSWKGDMWWFLRRVHPGRLTWNVQITYLERKMIFQTSMIIFHVNLQGCIFGLEATLEIFSFRQLLWFHPLQLQVMRGPLPAVRALKGVNWDHDTVAAH